jgi:hypothetical protein
MAEAQSGQTLPACCTPWFRCKQDDAEHTQNRTCSTADVGSPPKQSIENEMAKRMIAP